MFFTVFGLFLFLLGLDLFLRFIFFHLCKILIFLSPGVNKIETNKYINIVRGWNNWSVWEFFYLFKKWRDHNKVELGWFFEVNISMNYEKYFIIDSHFRLLASFRLQN